ncbi:Metallo-dependent phosphatase-like protein [Catenaria anguillulae PL171]|uniref:Metallo-dependent phosphatase-like protein n=1 Tax=Catenaria anguillulae PL171 TaxID=765915 RepID=A0A1Y2I3L3_9FUNG|nr:Metallo-dependent phosphatase-like protein [Catenaria anguillulae PL171]
MHIKAIAQLVFVVSALLFAVLRGLHLWTQAHTPLDSHSHVGLPSIPLAHEPAASSSATLDSAPIPAFHFVQISDLHISRYNTHGGHLFFLDFLRSVLPVIDPSLVFVTGDLTDAKSESKLTSQQFHDEWSAYSSALTAAHVDPTSRPHFWFDLRGNHDCFDVHDWSAPSNLFQNHSSTRAAGFSHLAQFTFGSYLFIGIDACPRRGIRRPFNFFGRIDQDDLNHIEDAYVRHPKTNHTFWFAHYPMGTIHAGAETVSSRGNSLAALARRASATMCGHLHRFKWGLGEQMYTQGSPAGVGSGGSGLLELELADVKHHAAYRVVVVDQDRVAFVDTEVRVRVQDEAGKGEHTSGTKHVAYPGQVTATFAAREKVVQPPVHVVTYPKDGRFAIPHRESLVSRMVPVHDAEELRTRPMRLFVWTHGKPEDVEIRAEIDGRPVNSPATYHHSATSNSSDPSPTMPLWTIPWDPQINLFDPSTTSLPLIHQLHITVHDRSTNLTSTSTTHFRVDGRRISTTPTSGEWIVSTNFDALIRRVLFAGYIPLLLVLALSKTYVICQGPAAYASWFHATSHALVTSDTQHELSPLRSVTWGLRALALRLCELARRNSVWYPLMLATCWLAVGPLLIGRFLSDSPSIWTQQLYWFGFYLDHTYVPVADAWLFATFKVWQVWWPFTLYVSFNAVPPVYLYAVGNVRRERPVHAWWTIRATVAAVVVYHVWNYVGLGIFYGWECVLASPLGWMYVWMIGILVRSMVRPWKPAPVGGSHGECWTGAERRKEVVEVVSSASVGARKAGKSARERQ